MPISLAKWLLDFFIKCQEKIWLRILHINLLSTEKLNDSLCVVCMSSLVHCYIAFMYMLDLQVVKGVFN